MNGEHWYSEMYRKMAGCLDDGGSSGLFIRRRREPEAVSSFNGAMAYYQFALVVGVCDNVSL